jgi:hypothetical protein
VPGTTYFNVQESNALLRMIGWSPCADVSLTAIRGAKSATCTTSPAPLAICRPDYNIAPTDTVDVVRAADGQIPLAAVRVTGGRRRPAEDAAPVQHAFNRPPCQYKATKRSTQRQYDRGQRCQICKRQPFVLTGEPK